MRRLALSLACAAGLVGLGGCASAPERPPTTTRDLRPAALEGRPLRVTTTINLVGDLARVVGAGRVQVTELMGPGVDPHLYKASAGDVRKLQGADLILYGGLHLEGKMVELLERHPRAVPVTEGLTPEQLLYPGGADSLPDPHVWFDVTLWKSAVETVRAALSGVDPAGAATYAGNAAAYLRQLDRLDAEVSALMRGVPQAQRVLITAHDAFSYFGRRYDVEVRGVQGLSTAAEAGTGDVQALARLMVERRIPAIFTESSVPQRTVDAVIAAAGAQGHRVTLGGELYSDALGQSGTPEGTYLGMVRHNARMIAAALQGGQP